jgi:hypothetical protein
MSVTSQGNGAQKKNRLVDPLERSKWLCARNFVLNTRKSVRVVE